MYIGDIIWTFKLKRVMVAKGVLLEGDMSRHLITTLIFFPFLFIKVNKQKRDFTLEEQ